MQTRTGLFRAAILFGALASAQIYANAAPAAPSFSTGTGTYYAPPIVTISDATSGAAIYYTTDGSTPTAASRFYSSPVTLSATATLRAIAVSAGASSSVSSATYTVTVPPKPGLSTGTGTYYVPVTVAISNYASCAKVYYTIDGSTPTTASPVYSSPLTISKTAALQAIAQCPGGSPSAMASATFTVSTPYAPSFSTGTGTYYAPATVTISEATKCATVYYTTDGSTPTTASPVYSGPVTISKTATLQAIAVCPGGSPSAVNSATYTVSTPYAPSFSTGTGTYYAPATVTISEATKCATVYYTTDGSTPTTASPVYSGPVTISKTATLQAIAVCPGGSPSAVNSATYTVSTPYTPSFSTGTGTYFAPATVTLSEITKCAIVYYTTDGSTPTTASLVYSGPLTISKTTTIAAMAQCPGGGPSTAKVNTYTLSPAAVPVISVSSGTFAKSLQVKISDATSGAGAVVHYTTNGQTPTTSSPVYQGPLTLSNTSSFSTTINLQAIAAVPNGFASAPASATYTILSTTTPVHSQNSGANFFGMEEIGVTNGTPWPQMSFGVLRLLSSQWSWNSLNPSRGTYQWQNLDSAIQVAQSNNTAVMYSFVSTPPWAIPAKVPLTEISRKGGVVTLTTTSPHGMYYTPQYKAGDQSSITVAGVTDSSFNGTFVLTGTPSPTTLTYAQSGTDGASSSGSLSSVCGGTSAPGGCAEAPAQLSDWDAYVTALVNHVGPGVIRYWEVWNEANIGDQWRGDPAVLVTMASHARNIIKAADPNAIVLSPSVTALFETPQLCATSDPRCGSTWMANWLSAGGAKAVDAIAFHGYPAIGTSPEQIQGGVTLLQQAMSQNGVGSMAIYDSESSWGLQTALPGASDQVAFVGRHFLLEHSIGVQASFWYAYDNANWGMMWSASAGMNAAGEAYEQVRRWLTGATVTNSCAPTAADPTTYSCTYSRPNGYSALALWSTSGNKTFAAPAGYVQYRDLGGNIIPVGAGAVPISDSPVLLESGSAF